jgi:hypothetical protein
MRTDPLDPTASGGAQAPPGRMRRAAAALMAAVAVLSFLPLFWGWHEVPFHLLNPRFSGVSWQRDLPQNLRHLPGDDATGVVMDYPNEYYTAQRLRRGELPWWNPDVGCGRPWIGNGQSHPFSPLLLPFFAAPSPWTYSLQFLFGSLICLAGAYRLFRLFDLGPIPSAAGAALWTFNPFTSVALIMSSVWSYWWMPWVCYGGLLAIRGRDRRGWLLASAAAALMALCGHPETALYLAEMAALILLGCGWAFRREASVGAILAGAAGAAAGAVLLALPQWLPLLLVLRESTWYKTLGQEGTNQFPGGLAFWTAPRSDLFLLPVLWALALAALWKPARAALGFILCLGFALALHSDALASALPLRLLRLNGLLPPLHGAELACVPMAGLAAFGLAKLLDAGWLKGAPGWKLLVAGAALALTGLALLRLPLGDEGAWLPAAWLLSCAALLGGLAVGKAGPFLGALLLSLLAATYPLATAQFRYPFFSGSPQPRWTAPLPPPRPGSPPPRIWAPASPVTEAPYLMPNLGLLSGLSDLRASQVINPAGSDVFARGWGPGGYLSRITFGFNYAPAPLLAFLGVGEVLNPRSGSPPSLEELAAGPRAFVVHEVLPIRGSPEALTLFKGLLREGGLHRAAVIEPRADAGPPPRVESAASPDAVEWVRYSPEELTLRVRTSAPGLLVLIEAYSPRWRAQVDGKPVPLLQTDVMFRGVSVTPGVHQVTLEYDARPLIWALAGGGAAWLLAAVLWLILPRRAPDVSPAKP